MDSWMQSGRELTISAIKQGQEWDMLVIGGGITGAGIAREAARQGMKVLLVEQRDYAWGTSSRSSKMVHGGLRYLAAGNFRLTSHSVKERERLMNEAPGLVDMMPYVWPHYKGAFPPALVFNTLLGIYDFFAGKRYRQYFRKEQAQYLLPHIRTENLTGATRFADAVTDDSRLVMRVLFEANKDGAQVINYMRAESLLEENNRVVGCQLHDALSDEKYSVRAKVVISATGAWADKFRKSLGAEGKIRPLRGSHIVVPSWRLPVSMSITLHHPDDKRALFIFPWEGMTVIGTTDLDNPELALTEPHITQQEVDYLLRAAGSLFPSVKLNEADVISTFAGVRPIVSSGALNPSAEKRDHSIWDDKGLITVSGGKLTTFRLIALDVLAAAQKYLPGLTSQDYGQSIFSPIENMPVEMRRLPKNLQRRLQGFYGQQISTLNECARLDGWEPVPGTLTLWAQVRHALRHEHVQHLDDVMLRRTRLGLYLPQGGVGIAARIKDMCQQELSWDDEQWAQEWQRYSDIWQQYYGLPLKNTK